jgi:hypothetical protein
MIEEENFHKRNLQNGLIDRIAEGIFLGDFPELYLYDLDEDNYLTYLPLENIITVYFDIQSEQQYEEIESKILARLSDLKGGCDMFGYDELEF